MTRQHLTNEPPSQDETFTRKVLSKVEATCQEGGACLAGSLHGILGAAGVNDSLAKVNSIMGYAFHFCLLEYAKRTEHHSIIEWDLFSRVLDRLGFEIQHFEGYLRDDWHHSDGTLAKSTQGIALDKLREDTWDAVCASIDQGIPAIAWSPMTVEQKKEGVGAFEWGLLVGYDKAQRTYTVHHRWRDNRAYTVPYDGFGYCDGANWYYVMVFSNHTPPNPQNTVIATLKDAIAFAEGTRYNKDKCCYRVAAVGLDAYQLWCNALKQGLPTPQAVRGNINELKFNRQMASEFLKESADLFQDDVAQALSSAAACYDMEVSVLTEARNISRTAHEKGGFSAAQNRETLSAISAAFEAEKLAIAHIKSALEKV